MTKTLRTSLAVLGAGLLLAVAACGDDDDADSGAAPSETTVAAASDTSSASGGAYGDSGTDAAAGEAVAVDVVDSDLGEILASDGATLYAFVPDNAGPPTCSGDCAANWPPLMGDSVTAGTGLEGDDFATAARDDGGNQVTFYGWPLYFYAGDAADGDVNGQGLGDNWYVVGPDGTLVGR